MSPSLGLRLEQFQTQAAAIRRLGAPFGPSACGGVSDSESPFLRSALESCDCEIVTPSCAAI